MSEQSAEISPEVAAQLATLRKSIDNLDDALIRVLAERFRLTQQVGELKAEHHLPASDPNREANQLGRPRARAADANLAPDFAERWSHFVVQEDIQHHRAIANGDK